MSSGLRRFLHLERPRAAAAPAEPPAPADRFGAVADAPGDAAPPTPPSGARLERFGPEPEPSLELADAAAAQPGTRCVRCGAENGAFAARCAGCDADLGAPEQREFDERLRAAREEDRRREEAALDERRRVLERDAAEEARARRELGATLAREVGERERRRLDAELPGLGWDGWGGSEWVPPALRVLRLVRNPSARIAVAAAAIGLPLVLLAIPGQRPRQVGAFLLLFLVVLLIPPGWRNRRWRRW